MKVHITSTPEFSQEKVDEVIALLNSVPGEIVFKKSPTFDTSTVVRTDERFESITDIENLSLVELFELVRIHRENSKNNEVKIQEGDFVVMITSIPNDQYWFSAVSEKNIFVYGDEWDLMSNVDSKYYIAHQCVENIFEYLLGIDVFNVKNDPSIHMETTGCLMDFCQNKEDILRKLQSANICESCYAKSVELGISDFITSHVVDLLEIIRKEFVVSKRFSSSNPTETVHVDDKGNISIGTRRVDFGDLQQAMYIFFLKNIEGVQRNRLCDHKSQIESIYKELRYEYDPKSITQMCCTKIKHGHIVERIKPTFEINRTRAKTAIKKTVGETMANQYAIQLITDESTQIKKFRIPLRPNQVDMHTKFLSL